MVSLHGYHIFRQDKIDKNGGGVAFFLSDQLQARILRHSNNNYCHKSKYLMAEISINMFSKILLAVVYRRPYFGFLTEFFNSFSELSTLFRHSIILGDFNADLFSTSFDAEQITSFVNSMILFWYHTIQLITRVQPLCLIYVL